MPVQILTKLATEAVRSLADKLAGRSPDKRSDLPAREIVLADLSKPDVRELLLRKNQLNQLIVVARAKLDITKWDDPRCGCSA